MEKMIAVMTKARKRFGREYPAQPTEFTVRLSGNKLTIFKHGAEGKTFEVGDEAEYDSYNLRYTGTISKITEKCVSIVKYKGHQYMEKTVRLDLSSFCWRNWDFDAARVAAENHETMMYI